VSDYDDRERAAIQAEAADAEATTFVERLHRERAATVEDAQAAFSAGQFDDARKHLAALRDLLPVGTLDIAALAGDGEDADRAIANALHLIDREERRQRPVLAPMLRPNPLPLAPDWLLAAPDPDNRRLVRGWLPDGRLAALSGDGAIGKSHVAVALAAAIAGGGEGTTPLIPDGQPGDTPRLRVRGPQAAAVIATWEDDDAECWRRVHALHRAGAEWASPEALEPTDDGGLHFLRPDGPVWAARKTGNAAALAVLTPAGDALLAYAAQRRARLLVMDPVAAAFGASEIDRAQVRAFCSHMDAWARSNRCAVLLVSHPPKAEKRTGGQSGSTDWRNAPRAVLTLTLENDPPLPVLTCDKSNYGRRPEPLALERQRGDGGMHWIERTMPAQEDDDDRTIA